MKRMTKDEMWAENRDLKTQNKMLLMNVSDLRRQVDALEQMRTMTERIRRADERIADLESRVVVEDDSPSVLSRWKEKT